MAEFTRPTLDQLDRESLARARREAYRLLAELRGLETAVTYGLPESTRTHLDMARQRASWVSLDLAQLADTLTLRTRAATPPQPGPDDPTDEPTDEPAAPGPTICGNEWTSRNNVTWVCGREAGHAGLHGVHGAQWPHDPPPHVHQWSGPYRFAGELMHDCLDCPATETADTWHELCGVSHLPGDCRGPRATEAEARVLDGNR